MERIDKKIAENHQRQDFLRKRMQSDKEELAKLESEARVLEHSQLAVVFSCEIKDVNTLVTKEHDTLMRLRSQGITDDMLEALAKGEITINTNSEEETNESNCDHCRQGPGWYYCKRVQPACRLQHQHS